jgi:hypothetical protein
MTELPKWAWDLVIAVQKHEDEHPKGGACFEAVLAPIPAEIRDQAAAIHSYTTGTSTAAWGRVHAQTAEFLASVEGLEFGPTIPGRSGG